MEKIDGPDMPFVQTQDKVVGILCSDIHLSHTPPKARQGERDWYGAMARPLGELQALSEKYKAPILCAGDVFDTWKVPPELINFALDFLPNMYAIPGQHDMPLHSMSLIKKSAFWTMVLAGKIKPLLTPKPVDIGRVVLYGFPWGVPIRPPVDPIEGKIHIALAHDFFWIKGHSFTGAPIDHQAHQYATRVQGFNCVAFGDNHKGFKIRLDGVPVMNCGGFMRRKSDEKQYRPQVGLFCASGRLITHRMSTANESFMTDGQIEAGHPNKKPSELSDLVSKLASISDQVTDYTEALRWMIEHQERKKPVSKRVKRIIMEALEYGKN